MNMEKNIKIKTEGEYFTFGILNTPAKQTEKLIILVHGLTGNPHEHQHFNAVKFFNQKGFATLRIDLYSGQKGSRKLSDSSIKTHTIDLNVTVSYFKKKYKAIYLVGHSLGGPTIINADLSVIKKIVLWDPSINLKNETDDIIYNKKIDQYFVRWGVDVALSKEMVEEFNANNDYANVLPRITEPLKIICASDSKTIIVDWKKAIKRAAGKKQVVVVKNADHGFNREGNEEELFKETLSWLKNG